MQGLTGVNEKRRIKATLIVENIFLANSCNYLLEPENYQLLVLLGWINSKLVNFTFKARSTSSNVNGYEVDNLPFIKTETNDEIKSLTSEILELKNKDSNADTSQLERKIDVIIYELFELDKDEIKIIENANA